MAQRTFLLNSCSPITDTASLWNHGQTRDIAEIAEAANIAPLPWFALFRKEDLRPVKVAREDWVRQETVEVEVLLPCTSTDQALINLIRALPMFERLTGEKEMAKAWWRRAIDTLKKHKLPYVAMDLSALLDTMSPAQLNQCVTEALEGQDHGWNVLRLRFLQWIDGVAPAPVGSTDGFETDACPRSLKNAQALDAGISPPGLTFAR